LENQKLLKRLIKISIILISIISCKEVVVEEVKNNLSSKTINYSEISLESVYKIKLYSNIDGWINYIELNEYVNQLNLKKKVSTEIKKNSEKIFIINSKLIHQIFDTINLSLLVLIFILLFLSFNSQRKWSNTYENLSKTRAINNNLIDYVSKIEEFYISELESLNIYRKTKPEDLIYLNKLPEKKESLFKKNLSSFIQGFTDSKYQKGY